MKNSFAIRYSIFALLLTSIAGIAQAQSGGGFDLNWSTVDGGGHMVSTGSGFELGGTIGQSDAQTPPVMSGGSFDLTGGFWPVTQVCYCPADMNGDGKRDGSDVSKFVSCLIAGGACSCADVHAAGGVSLADVGLFVSNLLTTAPCP